MKLYLILICSTIASIPILSIYTPAQVLGYEKDRHRTMLGEIKNDIKKNYFDPNLKGVDIEAKFKIADDKIKQAASIGQMSGIIAQFMLDFDDSHLFFLPPEKANKSDYGFRMRMIGEKCLIVRLDPKSDAAQKGIEIGDEVYAIEGYAPSRENFWKMEYFFYRLRPRPGLKMQMIKPDGKQVTVEIAAKITQGKKVLDATGGDINQIIREDEDAYYRAIKQYYFDKTPGVFAWKMPAFALDPDKIDGILGKAKQSSLILDLRGNGGGRVDMVLRLIGNLFPEDLKVGDEKTRKKTKEVIAKSRKKDVFTGKIIVLIDSGSASASEITARVIQLEKRGTVLGDSSAGAVMESQYFGHQVGMDVVAFYGASITVADLIMKDGKSLEKTGVTPDEKIIPTAADLAAGRDPVLARAFELLGVKVSPEEAGKMFPNDYEAR